MPAFNEISTAQLARLIGTPECPVIVDVRTDEDFDQDPFVAPTAMRHPHTDMRHPDMPRLIARLNGRSAVIICQKGLKLSQGVAGWLRSEGCTSETLEGGMFAWRDFAGAMRVPANNIPAPVQGSTLWVTRHRPKIDRIACPWLIRRFIDPEARFLFVAPDQVMGVAERFGATPFDIEGVRFSHRGEHCTFDTMLDEFSLDNAALRRLATVIRGADTNRHDLHPVAAGLLAISVGLSRQYRDDSAQLEAGIGLYDALYRWARDGVDEGHDWPNSGAK